MGKYFNLEKIAMHVKEINNLEDLYEDNPTAFHRAVAMRDEAPERLIGFSYKKKDGTSSIYVDKSTGTPEMHRSVRRHELVHDIRREKGLTAAKWADREGRGLRRGIGTFIEEFAATNSGNYSRTMQDSPLKKQLKVRLVYPLEQGIGAMRGKYFEFKNLRKVLK